MQLNDGICFVCVLETGPLTLIGLCNTTLLKEWLHASSWLYSMLEKMFDWSQNILPTKNVEQRSSNMHATRSNIVDPTKLFYNIMFERVAGA